MTSAFMVGLVGLVSSWSAPSQACSPLEEVDTQWFATAAPVGGAWWVEGYGVGDTVLLRGVDGAEDVNVDVVSVGASSIALAVPEVPVGSRYTVRDPISLDIEGREGFLEVIDGSVAPIDDEVPPVALQIALREVRQGYVDVAVSPIGGECEQATGWWSHIYGEGAFAVIDELPEGLVLDMTVRPRGEEAFSPVTSGNQIVFDGDLVATVDAALLPPPGTDTEFTVHARYRRVADGAAGPVVSIDVVIDPTQTERTEFVGCASAPVLPLAWTLVLLAARRRRR